MAALWAVSAVFPLLYTQNVNCVRVVATRDSETLFRNSVRTLGMTFTLLMRNYVDVFQ